MQNMTLTFSVITIFIFFVGFLSGRYYTKHPELNLHLKNSPPFIKKSERVSIHSPHLLFEQRMKIMNLINEKE